MIILSCCIIIFITYIAIFSILGYYFIKKRKIWDSLLSLESITDVFIEIFCCPEHFIFWIPFVDNDLAKTKCVRQIKTNEITKINIKKILEYIKSNINNIGSISNKLNKNIEKQKWILEGTLKDFNYLYNETTDFYNKLMDSYNILNDKVDDKEDNHTDLFNMDSQLLALEDLNILEQNIEVCDKIYDTLYDKLYDKLYDVNGKNIKILNNIESGYISGLLYNLIENIKIYKIMCMMEINK
jgi:hypothetical protein